MKKPAGSAERAMWVTGLGIMGTKQDATGMEKTATLVTL